MKAQDFIQAMNDIDEKYIKEAANYKPTQGHLKIWRAIAIAACCCLAVSAVLMTAIVSRQEPGGSVSSGDAGSYREAIQTSESAAEPAYYAADGDAVYDDMMYEAAAEEVYFEAKSTAGTLDAASSRQVLQGSTIQANSADLAEAETAEESVADTAAESIAQPAGEEPAESAPKIIYRVSMEMQTKEYENTLSEIEQAIAANNGYSESQNLSNGSNSYRSAYYTIRIPVENLDSFLAQTEEIAAVTNINKSAEDVSENYYDIQSRLVSAQTKLARLQELLREAEDMADIIELESAISDAQWEIDSYTGSLKYYDSQIQYSTVTISLQEVYEVVTEEVPQTFGEKIAQAFSQGVRSVGAFFKNAVLWISASWIWILIVAVAAALVILIIRHIRRR